MKQKENFFSDSYDALFHWNKDSWWQAFYDVSMPEDLENMGVKSVEEFKKLWWENIIVFGQVVGSEIAPNARKIEKEKIQLTPAGKVELPPTINSNMRKLLDVGLSAIGIDFAHGGICAPPIFEMCTIELLHRACPSTALNAIWYGCIARMIDHFASKELIDEYIPKIASGEWSGSMALTEADAGSDLGSIRTYGEKNADGSWRIFGSKRFISNANSQICLVLAKKAKGAEGLNEINMYICPHVIDGKDNYQITKLEEKIGLHGSATCELQFDGSKAFLVGEEGFGFRYMLQLMNEARLAVSFQALGVMESTFRVAKDYAQTRKAWGKPLAEHEIMAEKLLDMEVDLMAGRSLGYQATYAISISTMARKKIKLDKSLTEDQIFNLETEIAKSERRVRRWTPLLKYWTAEKAVEHARTCLQIHGGYGYTTEYSPEWLLREALILPLYEGTSQIQALMSLKDTMKEIIRKPSTFIENALGSKLTQISERDPLRKKLLKMRYVFNSSMVTLIFRMMKKNALKGLSKVQPNDIRRAIKIMTKELINFENLQLALLHAERICEMKALVAMAEALLRDSKYDSSRTWILERFMSKALPRMTLLQMEIEDQDQVILNKLNLNKKPHESSTASAH